MKIKSYEELNKLIAQSLGWVESTHYESQSEPIPDAEIEFYHPLDLSEDVLEEWFNDYGAAPDFSESWYCIEAFILPECDRRELLIEWRRSPRHVICLIATQQDIYSRPGGAMEHTGVGFKYPRSMALATCLAWLKFNGVPFSWEIGDAVLY